MMSTNTFIRPVPNLRFANEAALCDSYSRKQNPRFFFLSSGELQIITSIKPAANEFGFGQKYPEEDTHFYHIFSK